MDTNLTFRSLAKVSSEERLFRHGGAPGFFIVGVSVFCAMA